MVPGAPPNLVLFILIEDRKWYAPPLPFVFLSDFQLVFLTLSAETMLNLLEISLSSDVPASLQNIPEKYNIIIHLWTSCFYRLLKNLWRSPLASQIAYEYLQEFIHHS